VATVAEGDLEAFEADRVRAMRVRLIAIAVLNVAIWASQAVAYEDQIFPSRDYARPYRAAELLLCLALVGVAARRRAMREMEWAAAAILGALVVAHGAAILVVHESCVVPFLLTMEWGQIVIALGALLSFRPASALFMTAWVVGVGVVVLRPGFDADLEDHAVLLLIYGVVAASIRSHDVLRVQDFLLRRKLETANEALRASDAARSRLFVNLSHDLRTPLALIRGQAQSISATAPPETRAALGRIEAHATDLAELADQLIEAARLDAGRVTAARQTVDLAELAKHVQAQFEGGERTGRVSLVVTPRPGGARVLAEVDPAHLRRIALNLMSNAVRQLEVGATHVVLRVSDGDDGPTLDVENDGAPIPAERREIVFRRFAAFDDQGGLRSGIGLPLARELAELNGGSLVLLPGETTVFRLRLPRAAEGTAVYALAPPSGVERAPSPGPAPVAERAERSLLVVEDHPELRSLLVGLFASRFTVLEAGSVSAAREILARQAPTAVLCDLMLPDGRGYDVLSCLSERDDLAEAPLVFLSAVADEQERVRALSAGASDYVVKPFGAEELVARVEAACERRAARARALEEQRAEFLGELHDGVNAALARAALLLESAERRAGEPGSRQHELLAHARAAVLDALAEARSLIRLRQDRTVPWGLALLEIESALSEAVAGSGVSVELSEHSDDSVASLSAAEHHALCRTAVEGVTNAMKHTDATVVRARLEAERGEVHLVVTNEASDARASSVRGSGFGLHAARRRLERLGGSLDAGPSPEGAWRVAARMPAALSRVVGAA
jgi:signal transduction histidine kinase/DNA-binding response OmpR family regulator